MNEMPLLMFTLAEQTAVGAFVALVITHILRKNEAPLRFKAGIILFILIVLGMIASLFHLGQSVRALNVLRGLGSSWLSREILFVGLFALCVLIYAILAKLEKDQAAKIIGIVGAVCGVAAVLSTALAYMQPGVPAWDSPTTPLQFILTAILCGVSLYGALAASFGDTKKKKAAIIWWLVFVVLLVSQIVMRVMFFDNVTLLIDLVQNRIG